MISVIIPNYNHEKFLQRRIDSVLQQTYKDFEIIILDDCSSDNSTKIIEQYNSCSKIKVIIINNENSGNPFLQWKKGIELASGEYIWIAESDDFVESDFLQTAMEVLRKNTNATLFYCQSLTVDIHNEVIGSMLEWTKDLDKHQWNRDFVMNGNEFIIKFLSRKSVIPNASAVVFRNKENITANINTDMKMCGDWWFWINILKDNELAFSSSPLNYFRTHLFSTRNYTSMNKRFLFIREKILIINHIKLLFPNQEQILNQAMHYLILKSSYKINLKEIRQIKSIYLEELGKRLSILDILESKVRIFLANNIFLKNVF